LQVLSPLGHFSHISLLLVVVSGEWSVVNEEKNGLY